jgi:hypothetical protein
VCICWILFRAANFESAITLITQYLWLGQGGAAKLPSGLVYIAPGLLLQWLSSRYRFLDQLEKLEPGAFSFAYGSLQLRCCRWGFGHSSIFSSELASWPKMAQA